MGVKRNIASEMIDIVHYQRVRGYSLCRDGDVYVHYTFTLER